VEAVTVRQRIDQLAAEPPVGDLGYVADQRLVASALLGLQLLADEIDTLKAGGLPPQRSVPVAIPGEADVADVAAISDVVEQLRHLSEQVVRLTAAVKASAELPQLAHLSDQVADLTAAVMGTAEGEFEEEEEDEDEDEDEEDGEAQIAGETAESFEQKKHKKKKKKDKDKDKDREKKRTKNFMLE
jgi:hypothetical protein